MYDLRRNSFAYIRQTGRVQDLALLLNQNKYQMLFKLVETKFIFNLLII